MVPAAVPIGMLLQGCEALPLSARSVKPEGVNLLFQGHSRVFLTAPPWLNEGWASAQGPGPRSAHAPAPISLPRAP